MAKPRNRALTEHVPELESTQEPSESRVTPSEAAEGERVSWGDRRQFS
jgi:hypothetical protein